MANSKFSPGPWQVKSDHTRDDALTIISNVDGEYLDGVPHCTFDVIAQCVDEFGEALPSAEANARLIAAAPELLAALQAATGYLLNAKVDLETGCTKATAIKTIDGGLAMARAAIAKAEGSAA